MKSLTRTKKIILILGSCIVIAGIIVLTMTRTLSAQDEPQVAYKETTVAFGNLTVGVTESGSVTIGTVSQTYDLASTSTTSAASTSAASGSMTGAAGNSSTAAATGSSSIELVVGTVHVAAGQVVVAGDALLSLTAESVTEAKDTLNAAITSAELALRQAEIERDTAALQAQYAYTANKALDETAKATYNATISSLNLAVTTAQAEVSDAADRIAAIPAEITALQAESDSLDQQDPTYDSQVAEIAREIETLETEKADYEDKYDSLVAQLARAKREKTTQSISAEEKYEESLLTCENADVLYEIAMDGIDDAVNSATETLTTAQENVQDFVDFVGDGTILSDYSGTVTTVGYAAGDVLTASTAIAVFQDATAVTMVISVAQDDISVIQVGNTVNIEFTAYEDVVYQGTVKAIATSTTNARSTTVSYPVTVTVSGDISLVYAGMTGNVTFITKEVKDVLYVSNKAIVLDGSKAYVKKKAADGTITRVEITTGFSDGYQVEVTSGLVEGDIVLIESQVSGT